MRWLLSAPAAAGVVLVVAGLAFLMPRVRSGSHAASAATVVGIFAGLFVWLWGPCEVTRLQLPWLLVPSPSGDPSSWGWRGSVVLALRDVVADGLVVMTCGLLAAFPVRAWRAGRRRVPRRPWVWTEPACFTTAVVAAVLYAVVLTLDNNIVAGMAWVVGAGLLSWWITGRLILEREQVHRSMSVI